MNVVILNTNSFGGNYEYSRCIAKAYSDNEHITDCKVLIPANATQQENACYKKILISDLPRYKNKLFRKFYFLFRSIINPFIVFSFLRKAPPSLVIVNDYEQISSMLWVPFFYLLKPKHTFVVLLHDPDRDAYLPVRFLSELTMKAVMSIMDMALYHEILPDKTYYKKEIPKINIPHGLYEHPEYDQALLNSLVSQKGERKMMGIIGNIRDEKNYSFIIDCLPDLPHVVLLIAGKPSSSSVVIETYKEQIKKLNVLHQVIWIEKHLSDDEMQAIIKACDLVLLYYKHSFTSQSGLLNLIAPHKKRFIVSDSKSALTNVVRKFALAEIIPVNKKEFIDSVSRALYADVSTDQLEAWEHYLEYASWHNHVRIVVEHVHELHKRKKRIV
ncbi:glycosyltransferase [Flavobacterium sp.]|uniref:glycosyltransferase n=1 Tax=Flavobacterium sp. TaxID=239 RepID=UPI0025C11B36|nr:glycosyltransferase [Flavobacterium sp.]